MVVYSDYCEPRSVTQLCIFICASHERISSFGKLYHVEALCTGVDICYSYSEGILPGQNAPWFFPSFQNSSSCARTTRTLGYARSSLILPEVSFAVAGSRWTHKVMCPCSSRSQAMSDWPRMIRQSCTLSPARYIQPPSELVRARTFTWPGRCPGASMTYSDPSLK